MDSERFDKFAQLLGSAATRRHALGLLAGGLGLASLADIEADAKNKSKTHRCKTVGNKTITCPKKRICCDPKKSTGAGCAPAGAPVCCLSDGFAHRSNIVCCDRKTEGAEGICDNTHPHCCPKSIGGCCEKGLPLCCNNALGIYCCPDKTTCCETNLETGCCEDTEEMRAVSARAARRGAWKARVDSSVSAKVYTAAE